MCLLERRPRTFFCLFSIPAYIRPEIHALIHLPSRLLRGKEREILEREREKGNVPDVVKGKEEIPLSCWRNEVNSPTIKSVRLLSSSQKEDENQEKENSEA